MKNYTHIIFDLDRTLFDFERGAKEALQDLYQQYIQNNSKHKFDYFFKTYKSINKGLWDEYRQNNIVKEVLRIKRFSLSLEEMGIVKPHIASQMADMYIRITAEKAYLFPYTLETLEYLRSKYTLAIMTNGFKEVQYPKLDKSGIRDYFQYIYISEEVGYNKPDSRIFTHAMKDMNITADHGLFVGDDYEVDILGAAKVGMDQVFFNLKDEACSHEPKPTWQIKKLIEMKDFL